MPDGAPPSRHQGEREQVRRRPACARSARSSRRGPPAARSPGRSRATGPPDRTASPAARPRASTASGSTTTYRPSSVTASGRGRGDHSGTRSPTGWPNSFTSGTRSTLWSSRCLVTIRSARLWHGLTAVVAIGRAGPAAGADHPGRPGARRARSPPALADPAVAVRLLLHDPEQRAGRDRDRRCWPATRLRTGRAGGCSGWPAVIGITVTGVVHFILLRPLLDLDGADYVADKLLHMVVPVLAVVGWALFGPRPRVDAASAVLVGRLAARLARLDVSSSEACQRLVSLPVPRPPRGAARAVRRRHRGHHRLLRSSSSAARLVDRRIEPAPQAWDPYRGGTART